MAESWDIISADVVRALSDVGFPVTVTRQGPGPQTPWATDIQMTTEHVAQAVDQGIQSRRENGETVARRVLLMAAGDSAPRIGDTVTLRGQTHAVVTVMPIAPGGVDVAVKVEVRA